MKRRFMWGGIALGLAVAVVSIAGFVAMAQSSEKSGFALQVSPATLIGEIKPGISKDLDLKISNNGDKTEHLKIELRSFDVDKDTGEIKMGTAEPELIPEWVTFSDPVFNIESGKTFTQKIHVSLPQEAGFAYSFAVVISRANGDINKDSGTSFHGNIAVFTLLSVDKPGAKRSFEVNRFKTIDSFYEYMPVDFETVFFNNGNTFVQPTGNIFINRGDGSDNIATLKVNDGNGYLLPDRPRVMYSTWTGGFPEYKEVTDTETGEKKRELVWDWSKLGDFRIGEYTAKLVAVYNDGTRDVPVVMETTFWVFPWRIILGILGVLIIFTVGLATIWRKTHSTAKKLGKRRSKKSDTE